MSIPRAFRRAVRQARAFLRLQPERNAMPRLFWTTKTNPEHKCEHVRRDNTVCGGPARWLHVASKKEFCHPHFMTLSKVHRGFANMERRDIGEVVATYEARELLKTGGKP
jgi:hypothetical protein